MDASTAEQAILDLTNNVIASLQNIAIIYLFPWVGLLAVIIIIYGGIQYITGGASGAESGKKTIIAAVVGLIIIIFSYVIIQYILSLIYAGT